MVKSVKHTNWFVKTSTQLKTTDGKRVEVWEFRHQNDNDVLSAWARHFRNHYCLDSEIDALRKGTGYSRAEYLNKIKFPDGKTALGPSTRAGDFGEVLVADFLEYLLGFWVPRTRYGDKTARNESTRGCDVIGFKCESIERSSKNDTLAIYEVKCQFSGKTARPILQDAVTDSAKDIGRKAESLNALKQRLRARQKMSDAKAVERFQNEVDHPYVEVYGAAAIYERSLFNAALAKATQTTLHPQSGTLKLVVMRGSEMMKLTHALYKRAADEA